MHALIFDLDGTLVDTVYAHVLAWQCALAEAGIDIDSYRVHRHVGSSGKLIVRYAQRRARKELSAEEEQGIHRRHGELFRRMVSHPRPLPGAREIFPLLREHHVPHAIATASYQPLINPSLEAIEAPSTMLIVDGKGWLQGKPEPDLFLASAERLGIAPSQCVVVGDSIWDHLGARRAGMLSVGVLTGGYGVEELYHAGACRVYRNVAELLRNLDELGIML